MCVRMCACVLLTCVLHTYSPILLYGVYYVYPNSVFITALNDVNECVCCMCTVVTVYVVLAQECTQGPTSVVQCGLPCSADIEG